MLQDTVRGAEMLRRRLERRHPKDDLALDAQHLPARRQHSRVRALAHERLHRGGRDVDHVLAVVEHQQDLLVAECPGN